MKKIIIALSFFCCTILCYGQSKCKAAYLKKELLNGNVVSIKETFSNIDSSFYYNLYEYKEKEKIWTSYNDNKIWRKVIDCYNEKGLPVISYWVIETNGVKEQETWKYVYDMQGNLIKQLMEKSDGTKNTFYYRYNENGHLIEDIRLINGYPLPNASYYKCNEKGQTIENRDVFNDDIFGRTSTTVYDEHGNYTLINVYDSTGKKIYTMTYTYEYDEQGNWVKQTMNTEDNETITYRKITYEK